MKRTYLILLASVVMLLSTKFASAQAWEKSTKVLSLGIGASQFFHVGGYGGHGRPIGVYYAPITGQLNFQGEFGIHEYVGLGFTTGLGGRSWSGFGEVNFPIGILANFHFFQLIADKTGKDIHSDKLDVYAGVNAGSGIAAYVGSGSDAVGAIAFGGFQAGVRYYFTDTFGVNGEIGYGKSLINAGLVFKL